MIFRSSRTTLLSEMADTLLPRLERVAYAWCHNRELAQDLVQDTWEKALRNIKKLKDERAVEVWVFRIMANCHKDELRRRRVMEELDLQGFSLESGPEQEYEQDALIRRVRSVMQKLNEDQRKVVTLVDLMGFSYQEVSTILDIPAGTVMSRLSRARQNLKQLLVDGMTNNSKSVSYLYKKHD